MRIFNDAKDRLKWMVDFVNKQDLENPESFTDLDLDILRQEFHRYLSPIVIIDMSAETSLEAFKDLAGFLPTLPERAFYDFRKAEFINLQKRTSSLLDEFIDWQK